jgi:hypothetical protein
MDVPLSNTAEQVAPQLMPEGVEDTDPVPVPAKTTESVGLLKFAVTVVLAVRVKLQSPVPLHTVAVQPVKLDTLLGVAITVIAVPTG